MVVATVQNRVWGFWVCIAFITYLCFVLKIFLCYEQYSLGTHLSGGHLLKYLYQVFSCFTCSFLGNRLVGLLFRLSSYFFSFFKFCLASLGTCACVLERLVTLYLGFLENLAKRSFSCGRLKAAHNTVSNLGGGKRLSKT